MCNDVASWENIQEDRGRIIIFYFVYNFRRPLISPYATNGLTFFSLRENLFMNVNYQIKEEDQLTQISF